MASQASTRPTRPLVSISPMALFMAYTFLACCTNDGSSSCGRAITCTLFTFPTWAAAAAPTSVAAFTAATSPTTNAVTRPDPTVSHPAKVTSAAFNIASAASNKATRPVVSTIPSACFMVSFLLLCQFDFLRQMQPAGVGLVRIHVYVQLRAVVHADVDAIENDAGVATDAQLHQVPVLHAEVRGLVGIHVDMDGGSDDSLVELDDAARSHDVSSGRAGDVAGQPYRNVEA